MNADQRYYASSYGRFNTADTGPASAKDPGTWNRYAYVAGDPVNRIDPRGRCFLLTNNDGGYWNESNSTAEWELYTGLISWDNVVYSDESGCPDEDPPCGTTASSNNCPGGGGGDGGSGGGYFGSGGNSGTGKVTAVVPDANPLHQQMIQKAKLALRQSLAKDSDCEKWLASGNAHGDPRRFNQMWSSVTIGSGTFIGGQPSATFGAPSPYQISINDSGSFFSGNQGIAYVGSQWQSLMNTIQPNTDLGREFILLHELAHYYGVPGFGSDGGTGTDAGDIALQQHNNDLLLDHCSGIFSAQIF